MIRADTPPGTEVVCIDNLPGPYGAVNLCLGEIYTIKSIEFGLSGDYVAFIHEIVHPVAYRAPFGVLTIGFGLHRFRYLDLPPELMKLLEVQPILEDA
jgi:hypothetical protein